MSSLSDSEGVGHRIGSSWFGDASVATVLKQTGLLAILIAELLVITLRFDTETLSRVSGWGVFFEKYVAVVPQLFAVMTAAALIFGGRQISHELGRLGQRDAQSRGWPIWLAVQVLLFTTFYWFSTQIFEVDRGASSIWIVGWALLGIACGLAWLAAAIPPVTWRPLTRALVIPVTLGICVGGLAWSAGQYAVQYWEGLAFLTFHCVGFVLALCGLDPISDVSNLVLGTSAFVVRIDSACSGYEGMGLAVIFISGFLWWCRRDLWFPRSLLLIPIAVALMFLANCARIALLITIGHFGFSEIALGGFHSQAGWLAFNFVALGIVASARVSPVFSRAPVLASQRTESYAVPLLAPFVLLMLMVMLTGVVQTGFDWLYPVRFLTVGVALVWFARQYPTEVWKWSSAWAGPVCGIVVYVIWIALQSPQAFSSEVGLYSEARAQAPSWFAAWCVFRVLGSVVTVPLAEEFAFRGYLIPWLSSGGPKESTASRWSWSAVAISSLAFGALHPGQWLEAAIAGCLYAYAFCRRGCLMDAVLAHATTNALIAAQVLAFGHWGLWG